MWRANGELPDSTYSPLYHDRTALPPCGSTGRISVLLRLLQVQRYPASLPGGVCPGTHGTAISLRATKSDLFRGLSNFSLCVMSYVGYSKGWNRLHGGIAGPRGESRSEPHASTPTATAASRASRAYGLAYGRVWQAASHAVPEKFARRNHTLPAHGRDGRVRADPGSATCGCMPVTYLHCVLPI